MNSPLLYSDETGVLENDFLIDIEDDDPCLLIIDTDLQHTELFVHGYEIDNIVKSAIRKKNTTVTVFLAAGQFNSKDQNETT